MNKINDLSISQQVALWAILHLKKESFFTSEIAELGLFAKKKQYSLGGIMSSLYKNNVIEKLSGGRDKLWKLNPEIQNNKQRYKKEISKIKTYWR